MTKEESKAKSTDLSETADNANAELIITQLNSNPHLKTALMSYLQNEKLKTSSPPTPSPSESPSEKVSPPAKQIQTPVPKKRKQRYNA